MRDQIHCFSDADGKSVRLSANAQDKRPDEVREWSLNVQDTKQALRAMHKALSSKSSGIPGLSAAKGIVAGKGGSHRYRVSPNQARQVAIANSVDTLRKPTPKYRSVHEEERGFIPLLIAALVLSLFATQFIGMGLSPTLMTTILILVGVTAIYTAVRLYRINRARSFK